MSEAIPDEAVEEAAKAIPAGASIDKEDVLAILEAAAPHMLMRAWDRGNRSALGRPNPYRKDTPRSRHRPFVWDFGFGPVTSCRECADQGVDQTEAEWPCSFATKDQEWHSPRPKPSGN